MFNRTNRTFAVHVAKDQLRFFLGGVRPVGGQTKERVRAAVEWILRAQDAAGDGGVSMGYFPCENPGAWKTSYPETTGYIISSLLEFARCYRDEKVRQRAIKMAEWEIKVQMRSGAVQGGTLRPPEKQTPAAFNTGMVLNGWSSAFRSTGDKNFLDAGKRAAEFLLSDLDDEGYFRTNGEFVTKGLKTYNCLCAWALYRFGEDIQDHRLLEAAVKVVKATLRQQQSNGWFANNCLTRPEAPLLHTIGYTLQGILEVGILGRCSDFVDSVKMGVSPIMRRLSPRGFLHGRFYSDWEPAQFSSCLTGAAQIAVVCYRLFEKLGDEHYRDFADRVVNYLKSLQVIDSPVEPINGALAGSFPLTGSYMTLGYPNWATKYFIDALILQDRIGGA
ncbi:MAG: hypothetical protein DMG05_12925 [Acidobacteria bacterium]|nr:MAG: hypothetical protein DMG05_12925 [Acidobacteriota bacterium]